MNNFYLVCSEKIWNKNNYTKYFGNNKRFMMVEEAQLLRTIVGHCEYDQGFSKPRMIFFPHWSHIIPKEIYENHECVMFHMTDLPQGRGREPLQWLIESGKQDTVISVFKCSEGIDSGPIYDRIPLSLGGCAEEIYNRCSDLIFKKIKQMVDTAEMGLKENLEVQVGKPSKCGDPTNEILLDAIYNLDEIYNKIRAWDSISYPKAYIDMDDFLFEFSNAILRHNCVEANVKIIMKEN